MDVGGVDVEGDRTARVLLGVGVGGLGSLAVAGGLVGVRDEIDNVNVALFLVVVVLIAAKLGGRIAGAMSGLVAATAFDFFHTRPYGLFKIARADDLVTTMLLLAVGLFMGEVAERSSHFRDRMRDDQRQLRRLHRVAKSAASGGHDDRDLVLTVKAELIDTLRLEDCRFEVPPFVTELPHLGPDGAISGESSHLGLRGYELPERGVDLRVVGRGEIIGRFVLVPTPASGVSSERLLVAVALAHALGLAMAPAAS